MSKTHWTTCRCQPSLLCYFPGHANAFQILLCGVHPVLSWSSRLSLCTAYIPVYSLSWQSVVVHLHHMPEPSQSSLFMMRFIVSSCVCGLTLSLLIVSFHEIPIILLWYLWCASSSFFFCATVRAPQFGTV